MQSLDAGRSHQGPHTHFLLLALVYALMNAFIFFPLWLDVFIIHETLQLLQSLRRRRSNLNFKSNHFTLFLFPMWQKETKNMECCTDLTLWKHPSFMLQCIQYTCMLMSSCFYSFIKKKKIWRSIHQSIQTSYNSEKYSTRHGYDRIPWHQALSPLSLFILSDLSILIT